MSMYKFMRIRTWGEKSHILAFICALLCASKLICELVCAPILLCVLVCALVCVPKLGCALRVIAELISSQGGLCSWFWI